jgi:hypothetical protein
MTAGMLLLRRDVCDRFIKDNAVKCGVFRLHLDGEAN